MKVLKVAAAVSLAFATTSVVFASTGGAGIYNTRHDYATRSNYLGTVTDAGRAGMANTAGACSYCHTPHSAISTQLLWNKTLSGNAFTWDVAKTDGGTTFSTLAVGYKGPSVKCLSCHDGSVAIGDVALYRGSLATSANSFKVGDQPTSFTVGTATTTFTAGDTRPQFVIGSGGNLKGTHPIGMPYPYNNATNTYNGVTTGSSVALLEFVANPHQVTTASVGGGMSVSSSYPAANGAGNQVALVKLYTDTGGVITAGPTAGTSGMECSSCHDPHNKQTVDDWMLRGQANGQGQASGYLCQQCHIK
ncbi:MAG: cytochrome c3 family protein [Burkholderiaceae bacterium]|nr:cytochrome c3 family protein [Burkholderiaceae bacterium]